MKLEDQVCTFDQARRLKDLNLSLNTFFLWEGKLNEQSGDWEDIRLVVSTSQPGRGRSRIPAPNVAELGELLPPVVCLEEEDYYIQGSLGNREGDFHYIWFQSSLDNVEWELFPAVEKDTEAEARAETLIWLVENDYVGIEEVVAKNNQPVD